MSSRVIVVGSGIAGLTTALHASREHDVTVVTKGALGDGNTRRAQGGIAGVMFDDDSVESHITDTLGAGAGLCDRDAVRVLCEEGPRRIRELADSGVPFDRAGDTWAKGLEAAHSYPRILHAGGDATGAAIADTLVGRVRQADVRVIEHAMVVDLVMWHESVVGVDLRADDGAARLAADTVVLATGGAGQLFTRTTNPVGATGDGVAVALRAGAAVRDAEFHQFHPTALAGSGFLVSEAVRGAGAVLLDEAGRRFMLDVDPRAELAPRSVVALALARVMAAQDGRPAFLDATGIPDLELRFPTITAAVSAAGFDWRREPIPVTPAAHYWMGGIATDRDGRASVPGLFAVGEAAHTGVHGANRLASNSLLEGAVFAARAAAALPRETRGRLEARHGSVPEVRIPTCERAALQRLAWQHLGLERTEAGITAALTVLDEWDTAAECANSPGRTALEDRNLLVLARILARRALARTESRGAHTRLDFPTVHPELAHSTRTTALDQEVAAC